MTDHYTEATPEPGTVKLVNGIRYARCRHCHTEVSDRPDGWEHALNHQRQCPSQMDALLGLPDTVQGQPLGEAVAEARRQAVDD